LQSKCQYIPIGMDSESFGRSVGEIAFCYWLSRFREDFGPDPSQ
jgi:hypothetical protein